ncbi:50S ribosomal protein L33 [Streptomyces sp. NPDC005480]|uniref:50S ribosomal protein L33 n=1 Tax=Streptomyces sp. NPDC005480 TaxID=3154880 RepID=UPI0033A65273
MRSATRRLSSSRPSTSGCDQHIRYTPYVTRKNRLNDPDRLVLRKYDAVTGKHVLFREER